MPMGLIIIMVQGIMAQSITVIATKNIISTDTMVGIIGRRSTTTDSTDTVIATKNIIGTDSMVGFIERRSTTADSTDTVIICIGIIV